MANRDLLKEAIADAKSVKEAAIANAKAALEEAFTPYLKEKFTAKLAEMEAEDMDEAKEEMDENYSEDSMEEMSNPVMRKGLKGDDTEEKHLICYLKKRKACQNHIMSYIMQQHLIGFIIIILCR
jgi:TATA-binding protein-associated factor Taf7